ncbi:DedA family protein [Lentilactobacillus sp. Marseille-Q4993]|uniref:DedA family protein n=1 Tax=Lentilactobacillus sp. Marseille-Q4993 TaxID=3039492 RepID=UPI0024BC852B|nr:DedA family protein [Lentilactobacillus sp. Marseille-Q4993]
MAESQITELITQYGYLAIVFLLALENVFPPIPSEVVLVFAGYLTISSGLNIPMTILAACLGAFIGAIILYGVGKLLSVHQLQKVLAGRIGRVLHLKGEDVVKAGSFFSKYGGKAIFFGRCVPVVRSLVSIPAGMVEYPFARFTVLTLFGTLIWNTVLILVGHYAGHAWNSMLAVVDEWLIVILVIAVIIVAVFLVITWKRKRA